MQPIARYTRHYLAALCVTSASLSLTAGAQTIAITGGTIYPVSGPAIKGGTVVISNGKIVSVGANVSIPADAQRIDATGKIVTPGFINSATQLGVKEISGIAETRDTRAEGTKNIAAAFRIWDGLNSNSVLFGPTRNEGITSVVVVPDGGLIAGQAALIDLTTGRASQMVRKGPAAMVAQVGTPADAGTGARGELISKLRAVLDDAAYYRAHRADFDKRNAREMLGTRADLEALIPVLEGKVSLAVVADRADDIDGALAIARDYRLKLIVAGASEGWMRAPELAAAKASVLVGAMNNIPFSFAALNTRQDNAALLRKAGVKVAIIGNDNGSDEEQFNARTVKYEAGNAVAYGMPDDDALRALTLSPAEIFGADGQIGSIAPGKDANVVVWSGDPFEFATRVEHVFIRGREELRPDRQDLLTRRYRTLPMSHEGD